MRKSFFSRFVVFAGIVLGLMWSTSIVAQRISEQRMDSIVQRTMEVFNVPGIAVAVIEKGKVVYCKGHGLRSLADKLPVDRYTLFGIASNTKAFTTAALATLVDEKKLSLDERVRNIIPEFKMYSPFVTEEFTVRDLLTHRSGLGLGAGDLMIFPADNNFTKAEVMHNLRFLKPVSSFRTKFDYDNLLYIVAGEVIERIAKQPWTTYVEEHLLRPLGMKRSAASFLRLKDTTNVAVPYTPMKGELVATKRCYSEKVDAAGGIYANVDELSHWVLAQLNGGKYGENRIFSTRMSREMWLPHTMMRPNPMPFFTSHFKAYALGWQVQDVNGFRQVSHTGGLPGMVSQVLLLPDLKSGVVVLTNQQSGLAFMAISDMVKDALLKNGEHDRIGIYAKYARFSEQQAEKVMAKVKALTLKAKKKGVVATFAAEGTYKDAWFGEVRISKRNGGLYFASKRSPSMSGPMFFYGANSFVVEWEDRTMNADAYLLFSLDERGVPLSFTMKAISPETDFSFDFQDLLFKKR